MGNYRDWSLNLLNILGGPAISRGLGFDQPKILMYHAIIEKSVEGEKASHANVTLENFDGQIRYLAKHHNIIHLHQYISALKEGRRFPSNTVMIAFDDGYESVYTTALSVLRSYAVPATVFLSVEFVDTGKPMWDVDIDRRISRCHVPVIEVDLGRRRVFDVSEPSKKVRATYQILNYLSDQSNEARREVLGQLDAQIIMEDDSIPENLRPLNWDQVRDLRQSGIAIGSHGMSHSNLVRLGLDRLTWEVQESKRLIESRTGISVDLFAYPGGSLNDKVKEIVASIYQGAVAVRNGAHKTDVYCLPRVGVFGPNSMAVFTAKTSALGPLLTRMAAPLRRRG